MLFEDDAPLNKKPAQKKLDDLSVDELREYIEDLKAEITRVEDEIKQKQNHNKAAEALFGSKE